MTVKTIATSVAAVAAIGAAAAAVTSIASGMTPSGPAVSRVQPVAFGAPSPASGWGPRSAGWGSLPLAGAYPQPLDPAPAPAPAANVPTAAQLTGILTSLADPNLPFANKGGLVEGGIGPSEAHMADHELKKAANDGDLPLSFNVANIQPAGAGSATADVSVSGPKLSPPVTQNLTFVNQGSWMLSRNSAMELLQAAGAH
jgi:hypothetical protein